MELTIALAISIIGVVISVSSFVSSRKDKAVSHEAEEQKQFSKHDLIQYRLEKIEQNIEKILNKLDFYDKEIEEKVNKAIAVHIANYHK
jgi:type II secretory pathway pseudopilin PulG